MKHSKKIVTLLLLATFALSNCWSKDKEKYKFPSHPNHEFNYEITTIVRQMEENESQLIKPKVSTRDIDNILNSGKTHTKTTAFTHNNQSIITQESWTTKNPTYLTRRNLALLSALSVATIVPVNVEFSYTSHNSPAIHKGFYASPYLATLLGLYAGTTSNAPLFSASSQSQIRTIHEYSFEQAQQENIISQEQVEELQGKYHDNCKDIKFSKIKYEYGNEPVIEFIAKTIDGIPVA